MNRSVSHIQIRHAYDFSLCFLHELLMSFLNIYTYEYIKLILQSCFIVSSNNVDIDTILFNFELV